MENQPGWGPTIEYSIRDCNFRVDFRTMVQTNLETGRARAIFFV
jgi:hypothetical protein